jgi:hypothetical protein
VQEGSDLDLLVVAATVSRVHLAVEIAEAIRPILAPLEFDILIRTPQLPALGAGASHIWFCQPRC